MTIPNDIPGDEESYLCNLHKLEKETEKRTPNPEILIELMGQTFVNRWTWIVEEALDIYKICEKFPLL